MSNNKWDFQVTTKVDLSQELIEDLICAALEGGSNYWANQFKSDLFPDGAEFGHEALVRGSPCKVREDEGDKWHDVTRNDIQDALEVMPADYPETWRRITGDCWDANDADVLFQIAVLGEVVYG